MADDKEMFKRSDNPTLSPKVFEKARQSGATGVMTVEGTVNKAGILMLLLAASAAYSGWQILYAGNQDFSAMAIPALIVGLLLSLIIIFVPTTAPYLAPVYAVAEGVAIGVVSAIFEARYPGIAAQAGGLTIMTLAAMLGLYKTGVIRATAGFKKGMMIALVAIMLMFLLEIGMSFFGHPLGFMTDNSPLGIGVAIAITGVAALCLILDFDRIEQGVAAGAPKFMEWYAGFGLMVTLVWLYIRMLRLLSIFRKR
jgi:uncharacterized YccA/Bax inhibitor family protein